MIEKIMKTTFNLNPKVLKLGLSAYNCAAKKHIPKKDYLTIIDFSLPSEKKRLWVIDLTQKKVIFNTLVAHGKNSGLFTAVKFSNRPQSLQSSLGLYLTSSIYFGSHGKSLHLIGLDKGYNDKAFSRRIVMHGASYVSDTFVAHYHRIGRSWGCFALPMNKIGPVITKIKNGSLIFAYADQKKWIESSKFLHCDTKNQ